MKSGLTVARNAVWLIAQPVLLGLIAVVVTAVVARYLGTAEYGTLVLLLSFIGLFTPISSLGLRPYSVREIAASRERAAEIVEDILAVRLVLALLAMTVAGLYVGFVDRHVPPALIALLAAQLLVSTPATCFVDGLYGIEAMKSVAAVMGTSGMVVQLSCVAAVALDTGLVGVAAAYVLGSAAMLAMGAYMFRRHVGPFRLRRPVRDHWRHLRASAAFFAQNVVDTVRMRIDVVLVSSILGVHAAGLYGAPLSLIQRLDVLQDGISTALFPRVADLHAKSPGELAGLVQGAMKMVLVISTPIAVGIPFVSEGLVELIFGAKFAGSAPLLTILGASVPFGFVFGIMFNVLRGVWLHALVLKVSIVATGLSVAFLVVGMRMAGVEGAAAGFTLGMAILALALTAVHALRVGPPVAWHDLARIALANVVMAAALWTIRDAHLAVKIVLAAVVFAAMVLVLRIVSIGMLKAIFRRPQVAG